MRIDKLRYFHVHYSFEGGVGSVSTEVGGMLNHKSFKEDMKKSFPKYNNVFILSWVEMSKEDFEDFIKED